MSQSVMPSTPEVQRPAALEVGLTAAQREHLHAQVSYAAETVAPNWPIRTFISRNPLSGFESMTFDMAIRRAEGLLGGRGLLSLEEYRACYREGRILQEDVRAAIQKHWPSASQAEPIGSSNLAPLDILLIHVVFGINELHPNLYEWTMQQGKSLDTLRADVPEETKARIREQISAHLRAVGLWQGDRPLADWLAELTGLDVPQWIIESIVRVHEAASSHNESSSARPQSQHHLLSTALHRRAGNGMPSALLKIFPEPAIYRTQLRRYYERVRSEGILSSRSFEEFAEWWMLGEAQLLDALLSYGCGAQTKLEKFAAWLSKPEHAETWYLKNLWLSVIDALGVDDPLLPDALRAWMPGFRRRTQREKSSPTMLSLSLVKPLSDWVGELSGEDLVNQLNEVMVRWCSTFLDEGLADWAMPHRAHGLYRAWKRLVQHDYSLNLNGMGRMKRELARWPDDPADAIVASLRRMEIPEEQWEEYFRRHLVELPGWVGYIRWRQQNPDSLQQQQAPVDCAEYLAVRLWYEAALVERACREHWGIAGTLPAVEAYCRIHGAAVGTRHNRHRRDVDRASHEAWRLFQLAQFLGWTAKDVQALSSQDIETVLSWLDRIPTDRHGLLWQEAYEASYRRTLLNGLMPPAQHALNQQGADAHSIGPPVARPDAQAIFCIDVRSEPLRRHLESQGNIETIGFAGFFGVPLCYRGLGTEDEAALCPVLIKPKNIVHEVPRTGQEQPARRFAQGLRWSQFGQELWHQLHRHPLASFVLIDMMGWMSSVAMVGRTLFPAAFHRALTWIKDQVQPSVSTTIPVNKLSKEEAERILDHMEQQRIRAFLDRSSRWQSLHARLQADHLALLHRQALNVRARKGGRQVELPVPDEETLRSLNLSTVEWTELIEALWFQCGITMENREAQLDRLSAKGFTLAEQTFMVERALQLTGLTQTFARLVLWCGHGSTTANNPYAAAYDCGACGGNHGGPNARVLAAMANNPDVRHQLRDRGIVIPDDTWFLAGEHNTTTDRVVFFDLEDVPLSHRADVARLEEALFRASLALAQERCQRLPDAPRPRDGLMALRHTFRRSVDWAQIRPEWGLSRNAAFIIGSRDLTRHLDLQGRTFLHNYDASHDRAGKVLETIMTAPLVVAEWINLQYFFSTVDPWVYGAGSKVLHNVVGGIGVMLGAHADFQQGLPLQAVRDGMRLYHEPLRLLVVIQAPPQAIASIIQQHTILQHFFHHGWLLLLANDPDTHDWWEYLPNGEWRALRQVSGSKPHPISG